MATPTDATGMSHLAEALLLDTLKDIRNGVSDLRDDVKALDGRFDKLEDDHEALRNEFENYRTAQRSRAAAHKFRGHCWAKLTRCIREAGKNWRTWAGLVLLFVGLASGLSARELFETAMVLLGG